MPEVLIKLMGEEAPRVCEWRGDFLQLADLDVAVGGLAGFDLELLHHVAALLWVCSGQDLGLREFGARLPSSAESIRRMREGAVLIWEQTKEPADIGN